MKRQRKAGSESPDRDSEDDWLDYRLENDPRFLQRIESARRSLQEKQGVRLEEIGFGIAATESDLLVEPGFDSAV